MSTNNHAGVGGSQQGTVNARVGPISAKAHSLYSKGHYLEALSVCEQVYELDAFRTDNLLLLGAIHFQLRNYSESVFYNQQCIRVDPNFAEAYSNLGNALKELGDVNAASQFYMKAIKLKPKYADAYNNLASTYMQMGKTQEATETYQMALILNPSLVDAHSNLGNLYKATGDLDNAKKCYLEAIRIKPDFAIGWNNVAGVFKDEGQLDTAVAYYKEAIRLCPLFADSYSNLGCVLKEMNKIDEALISYETAIKLRPDFAIAHANVGACYYDSGNIPKALASFKHAIQLEPNFPDCLVNMGNALREDARLDEAVECYRKALQLKPDHPHGWNNLANALKDKGQMKEAVHCYVTAIRLMPNFSAAHSNLASVLKDQGKVEEALAHYHEAVTIDPLFSDGYSNMGNTYKDMGQIEEAISCYKTAVKIKPDNAVAMANLAAAYKDSGALADAILWYRQALQIKPHFPEAFCNLVHSLSIVCDWGSREDDLTRLSQITEMELLSSVSKPSAMPSVQPFQSLIYPFSLAEMLQIARKFAARAKLNVALTDTYFIHKPKPKTARLKIGYVSSDFGNHPLSHLMQSVFGLHDRTKFDVTCYALTPPDGSACRHHIEESVETFKDISKLHSGDAAQLINNDGIHILVNLNGYTKGARNEIFALQPAPIQVAYLGFCGTMGADYIQYMVADGTVLPKEFRPYYDEKIISMPHSYFVADHKQSARDLLHGEGQNLPTRAYYGVPEDKFVFCNFNQLYKIDPQIFDVWMRILKRIPNAVLWLLRFPAVGEENILKEARERGVRPDQIIFSDVVPREEHVKRGVLADLFLDTPLCNAHTTACDILWGGTPMLTLMGDKMAARVGASLLRAAGLGELVTTSLEAYEDLAVALAQDQERLFAMRRHLENNRESCAAFDTARWVRNLEDGFRAVWSRHARGLPTDDVDVEDTQPVFTEGPGIQLL